MVEAARVANGLAILVAAPKRRRGRLAISADGSFPPRRRHAPLRLDQGPVGAIHFVVEPAGVAQVVTVAVSPPQGSGRGAAVDTFSTLCKRKFVSKLRRQEP